MEQIGVLFLRVLAVSAGCSVVLGPLLVLAPRMRRRVAARSFYVLFLLLALRLALPVEVKLPAPAVRVHVPETVTIPAPRPAAGPLLPELPVVQPPGNSPAPAAERKVPLPQIAGTLWAAGAAAYALWLAGGYALARRRLLRGAVPAEEWEENTLECLREELGVKRPVRLYRSGHAATPLALGLFAPAVVLPPRPFGGEELELAFRHELTHIRRWDVAYKLVLSLAGAVNWFNPLVWLMNREAGRNLELCCDDEVTRDLSDAQRRRYGTMLLDAAARHIPFSTCFSGGKNQMKERLSNLFQEKKNSAVLVGLVLAAALLAGGLVVWEKADASVPTGDAGTPGGSPELPAPALSPENEARRALYKDYFYARFKENEASVVLADITGDGLDEMLVLTMDSGSGPVDLRGSLPPARPEFFFGQIKCFGASDTAVVEYSSISEVGSPHAGWGYVYLVPRPDGDGFAILDFRPYTGQGSASYTYAVYGLEGLDEHDVWLWLDGGEAYFSLDPVESLDPDNGDDATLEEVRAFLERAQAYRDSGVALLVFNESYDGSTGGPEFACLNTAPADVFSGKIEMSVPGLREHVDAGGEPVQFALPPAAPAAPKEALDRLEASVESYPDGYVFRIPNYKGEWYVHIAGRMRMDWASHPAGTPDMFMAVHYLEDEQWKPGKRYAFDTEGAYFSELTLTATVTAPDGTKEERTVTLMKDGEMPQ